MRGLVIVLVIGCGRLGFDEMSTTGASSSAITVVQSAAMLGAADATVTLDIAPTQRGDLIAVATAAISAQSPVAGVSNDAGDSFVSSGTADLCNAHKTIGELWFATAAGGATSVTITSAAADDREVWVLEVAGASVLDQIDKVDNANTTSAIVAAPSLSPSTYPALLISQLNDPSSVGDVIAGSPFIALPVLHGDDAAYAIVTTPGDYGAIWGNTVSGEYCGFTAAFR